LEADVGAMASVRGMVRKGNEGSSRQADKASLRHHPSDSPV